MSDTELKLQNGKYTASRYGGLETVRGSGELAQRVEMKLCARRGGFALMPEFGSRLYLLPTIPPSQREAAARQYIAEALADETGIRLESLELFPSGDDGVKLSMVFSAADGGFEIEWGN